MSSYDIKYLIIQHYLGTATDAERQALLSVIADDQQRETFAETVTALFGSSTHLPDSGDNWDWIIERVVSMDKVAAAPVRPMQSGQHLRKWWRAAASVILLLGLGAYLWTRNGRTAPHFAAARDIQAGKDGAILTLADGSRVSLDTVRNSVIALQGGATARVVNGALQYEGAGTEVLYNTMTTPRGRQFHLTLPDGTAVWLNSASSIRYPTVFRGKDRRVTITGEAYFEVAKNNAMPFYLNANDKAGVEVLGTHFNVNAYDNETTINTTLIEGAVRVTAGTDSTSTAAQTSVILRPGQQAQARTDQAPAGASRDRLKVIGHANLDKTLAWKNGLFYFEGAGLLEIMRQVERWYDIDVVFEKGVRDAEFAGEMTRGIPLSGFLIILERSDVHYKLEGRTLTILP